MSRRRIVKTVIDLLMSVTILFLMNDQFWGNARHEWAGIGVFVLFIVHHILNVGWYKSLFRGRYTPMRVFQITIDISVLITMFMLLYSSLFISRNIFTFLPIQSGMALARKLHLLGSFWGFVLMSIHLGMHLNLIISKIKKHYPIFGTRAGTVILVLIGLLVSAFGIYTFISYDYDSYLFLKSEFVKIDADESFLLYFAKSVSLMGLFAFLSHCISVMLRLFQANKKAI